MSGEATVPSTPESRPVHIYALADPRTPHDYRYVGRTVWQPDERLNSHIQVAMARKRDGSWRNAVTHNIAWIRSVIRAGYRPVISVLAMVQASRRVFAEQQWIASMKEAGYRLTNATAGGEGSYLYKPTGQTRQRQSEGNRRRFENNPAEREFYRRKILRQYEGEEGRRRLSESATAQWAKPGAREAHSARLKEVFSDPELRARRGAILSQMLMETERGRQIRADTGLRLAGEGNHQAKLTWAKVRQIRAEYAAGGISQAALGRRHGVTQGLVWQIVRQRIWRES